MIRTAQNKKRNIIYFSSCDVFYVVQALSSPLTGRVQFFFFTFLCFVLPPHSVSSGLLELLRNPSFSVREFAHRGPTTMGELAKTPLRDLGILSNFRRLVHWILEEKIQNYAKKCEISL